MHLSTTLCRRSGLSRHGSARLIGCLLFALALAWSAPSAAQSGYFYLDRVQLAGAPDDGITVLRPYVPPGTRVYATAAVGYAHNPLRSDTVTDDPLAESRIDNPIQGQLIAYGALGIQLAGRVTAQVTLPVSLLTLTGADPQAQGVGTGGIEDAGTAVHDLRIDARLRTFESDDGRARFGIGGALFSTTGNTYAFASDEQLTAWVFGAAEFDFGDFLLSGTIGPHFRPENGVGGPNGALTVGNELRWAFGAYLPMRGGRARLGGELFGSTGLLSSAGPDDENTVFGARNTSIEWLGQFRFPIGPGDSFYVNGGAGTRLSIGYGAPDVRGMLVIGTAVPLDKPEPPARKKVIVPDARDYDPDSDSDGYPDSIDQCPTEPEDRKEPAPSDGCPVDVDRDGDGIPDVSDRCPTKPEDKDGIQDEDGCPEDDVDLDGIPDASDSCPTEAGPRSMDPARHGCPDRDPDRDGIEGEEDRCPTEPGLRSDDPEKNGCPTLTRVHEDKVELLQPIEFETGRAVLRPGSTPILDEIVALLLARPELRLGVYGHTDDRGGPAFNLRLSKERAAACVTYLVERGIDPKRLESEGFGLTRPIADNKTPEGRAKNRRVDFQILEE